MTAASQAAIAATASAPATGGGTAASGKTGSRLDTTFATQTPALGLTSAAPIRVGATATPEASAKPAAQVAAAMVSMARTGTGSGALVLRLNPVELGQVQIRIDRASDGTSAVQVSADRPETLQLLVQDATHLHQALDQAGVAALGRSLTFQLASPSAPNGAGTSANAGFGASGGGGGNAAGDGQSSGGQFEGGRGRAPSVFLTEDAVSASGPAARWLRAGLNIMA